jgi:hypothetical protein
MRVISWGDFPTWALAVIALLALIAATAACFKQADAAKKLGEQVDLQRDQFRDQQNAMTSRRALRHLLGWQRDLPSLLLPPGQRPSLRRK